MIKKLGAKSAFSKKGKMKNIKKYTTYWVATLRGWEAFIEKDRSKWLIECRRQERLRGKRPHTERRVAIFLLSKSRHAVKDEETYQETQVFEAKY